VAAGTCYRSTSSPQVRPLLLVMYSVQCTRASELLTVLRSSQQPRGRQSVIQYSLQVL
jgi:hypothetical protein